MKGKVGSKNSVRKHTCPFENLKTFEVIDEVKSRNLDIKNLKATKKDLLPVLKKELKGGKRVPVLLFNNPKISMMECMHDIAGHIDNILEELAHHLNISDKQKFDEILQVYHSEKDKKRCCDKRKILLQMTHFLCYKINGKVLKLLEPNLKCKEFCT